MVNAPSSGGKILVCVCGGIAAYKVCHVVSRLVQEKFSVHVAMTSAAKRFVGPLTFETLTARPVYLSLWQNPDPAHPPHIQLAQESDLILVAPATANMLAKMAQGLADDLVSSVLLAADPKKIVVAPAMNKMMWQNLATARNCNLLAQAGVGVVGPGAGWQACRTLGEGRMSEPEEILTYITQRLAAKTAV